RQRLGDVLVVSTRDGPVNIAAVELNDPEVVVRCQLVTLLLGKVSFTGGNPAVVFQVPNGCEGNQRSGCIDRSEVVAGTCLVGGRRRTDGGRPGNVVLRPGKVRQPASDVGHLRRLPENRVVHAGGHSTDERSEGAVVG